jgi:hypothetical protein
MLFSFFFYFLFSLQIMQVSPYRVEYCIWTFILSLQDCNFIMIVLQLSSSGFELHRLSLQDQSFTTEF